jgi:hypothetical protein
MSNRSVLLSASVALIAGAGFSHHAAAAAADQGGYVAMDPYSVSDVQSLQTAANTPCPRQQSANPASTFCGAVDGILLRTGWCNFEPDHASAGPNNTSCHYILGYSNGAGSPAQQLPVASGQEYTTPCGQNFDVCRNAGSGSLGSVISLIAQINANRAATRYLPPLKLSVGLEAGMWTPVSVLSSVGYVDVPHNTTSSGNPNAEQCYRLPKVWQQAYVNDYNAANDQLISFINNQLGGQSNIVIVKASAIGGDDLEVEMPGAASAVTAPGADPMQPANNLGAPMNCSSVTPGAQTWLNAYTSAPLPGLTYSQAVENTFGAVIGHEYATITRLNLNALISIATTNGNAFAQVDCGISGATACTISPTNGDWAKYYLSQYMDDLFNGGVAGRAAASAFSTVLTYQPMQMPPSAVSVNWTALTTAPVVASQQMTCAINNTNPANDPTLMLNGLPQPLAGVGATVGWQTQVQQGGLCAASPHDQYTQMLSNGINQGGQFIEVETDAAITDVAACGSDLANASQQLQASRMQSCQF